MRTPASKGALFLATIAVAGVAPGTVFSTTPPLIVYNPVGSGVFTRIRRVYMGFVSGTLGAGFMAHGKNATQGATGVPTGGTAITPQGAVIGDAGAASKVFTGATLAAAPTLIRPSFSMGALVTTTAAVPTLDVDDLGDYPFVLREGVVWAFQGIAGAGTTPLVSLAVLFEEANTPDF